MSQQDWNKDELPDMPAAPHEGAEGVTEEYAENRRPKINTSTVALIASFAAGLIVLYLLGLQNKPRSASAGEQAKADELEQRIHLLLENKDTQKGMNKFFSGTQELVERLNKFANPRRTESELPSNPFAREVPKEPDPIAAVQPKENQVLPPNPEDAADLRAAAEEFNKLKLQGVMLGSPSSALINNQMVQVGYTFTYLKVSDIKSDGVIMEYKDRKYKLSSNGSKP